MDADRLSAVPSRVGCDRVLNQGPTHTARGPSGGRPLRPSGTPREDSLPGSAVKTATPAADVVSMPERNAQDVTPERLPQPQAVTDQDLQPEDVAIQAEDDDPDGLAGDPLDEEVPS